MNDGEISNSRFSSHHSQSLFIHFDYIICPICQVEYISPDTCKFGKCQHQFCFGCLQNHIQASVGNLNFPVCPQYGCGLKLDLTSELYRRLPTNLKAKIHKISSFKQILSNPLLKPCQKPQCLGIIHTDKSMQCQICHAQHCKACFNLAHQGQCELKVAVQLQMTKKYRQCNQCGRVIQKTEGCTHMTCPCGNYFCYSCGQVLEGDHVCESPNNLNCLQKLRWQVQHLQFWYENASCSLLGVLLFFSPPANISKFLKVLWVLPFTLTLYPLLLLAALALSLITISVILAMGVIVTLLIPLTSVCSNGMNLCPNNFLLSHCGCFLTLVLIIILYPIFYLLNLLQLLCEVILKQGVNLFIPFIDLFQGIKLVLFFPCLMLVDNESFYLATLRMRQQEPHILFNQGLQLKNYEEA